MKTADLQLYLRLLSHVRPYWRVLSFALVCMIVIAVAGPVIAAMVQSLFDDLAAMQNVGTPVMALVLVFVLRGLATYANGVAIAWIGGRIVMDLRSCMFDRLNGAPLTILDETQPALTLSKFTFDVSRLSESASYVLTVLVRDSVAVAGLLAWMFYLNWNLAIIVLLIFPLLALLLRVLARKLREDSQCEQERMGRLTHVIDEVARAQKIIRVFGMQAREKERFSEASDTLRKAQMRLSLTATATVPLVQIISVTALAVVVYMCASKVASATITVGGFASFFTATGLLFTPVKRLARINVSLQQGLAAAESVFQSLDAPVEADSGTRHLQDVRGRIEFRSVTFSYSSADTGALSGVDLVIEPGETLALIGPSGGGKSTIAQLIPRFYEPDEGEILLDGVDVRELSIDSLRGQIALVSQDVVLFDDSVWANISFGRVGHCSRDEIERAARDAHALEFITRLPRGFDTRIGDRGARLSGGQRQRLAIARAFLKDAPILILDEATSSLDSDSEQLVRAALRRLRAGRTTLVIAHRLSSVEDADRIAVVENGRISALGAHDELKTSSATYDALYRGQFPGRMRVGSG